MTGADGKEQGVPNGPHPFAAEALKDALAAARAIEHEGSRARALTDLFPHLPEDLRAEALKDALTTARAIEHEGSRAEALTILFPHLPEDLRAEALKDALAAARSNEEEWSRVSLFTDLFPHLPEDLRAEALKDALAAARAIEYEGSRAEALADLTPHLPEDLRAEALRDILAVVRTIEDEAERADAITNLFPHLPKDLKAEALNVAWSIRDTIRAQILARLALATTVEPFGRHSLQTHVAGPVRFPRVRRAPSEETEFRCHFSAEMQARPVLGRSTELKVTVSRDELEKLLSPTTQTGEADVGAHEDLLIVVRARANCRVVGFDRKIVRPPAQHHPVELIFEIAGGRESLGEIFVEARQGARRLLTLVLQPHFVSETESLSATASISTSKSEAPMVQLRILEEPLSSGQLRLHFVVQCRELGLNINQRSEPMRHTRERFVADLYKQLETFWANDGKDYQRFLGRVRDRGAELFEELVPESIRHELWKHRDAIGSIEAISEEPFIPWEIAHLVEPGRPVTTDRTFFLCELGLIRWLDNLEWPPSRLILRPGRAWHVVPDYPKREWKLAGAQAEKQMLVDLFGAQAGPVESMALVKLLRDANEVDLLHFACHGTAESAAIWNAGLLLEGRMDGNRYRPDPLEVNQVKQNAQLGGADGSKPMVFLNACQVGRQGYTLTGTGGLADAFLRRGAGMFVGTLWSVGDSTSLCFARTFYERLKAGETLTLASRAARVAAKQAQEATWLSYTVYGHPYARLDFEGPA